MKSNMVWQQNKETFWPGNTFNNTKLLPPAIYRFGASPEGWFLEKTASKYAFPYKIYGVHDAIINRVKRAWKGLPSNFGVLLNGLKGTGKTITAQMIVNWAIEEEGMAVLNVHSPIPLGAIMEHIEQPLLVLFDEFEKTHDEGDAQQSLLSAIDGLSRNEHKRLFLFTTNTKKVNENLIDRPSRIRYSWEFLRVGNDLIEMLLDDMLDKSLASMRPEIISYLNMREVLTIDVVKTVIMECNIFCEPPMEFKPFMNLTEKEPGSFRVHIIGDLGDEMKVSDWFKCNNGSWLLSIMSKSGQQGFIDKYCALKQKASVQSTMGQVIQIIGPTDEPDTWICNVQLSAYDTWVGNKLAQYAGHYLWFDERPKGWNPPDWAAKLEAGEKLSKAEQQEFNDWRGSNSVYGTGKAKNVKVRFSLDETPYQYNYRSMMSWSGD